MNCPLLYVVFSAMALAKFAFLGGCCAAAAMMSCAEVLGLLVAAGMCMARWVGCKKKPVEPSCAKQYVKNDSVCKRQELKALVQLRPQTTLTAVTSPSHSFTPHLAYAGRPDPTAQHNSRPTPTPQ